MLELRDFGKLYTFRNVTVYIRPREQEKRLSKQKLLREIIAATALLNLRYLHRMININIIHSTVQFNADTHIRGNIDLNIPVWRRISCL